MFQFIVKFFCFLKRKSSIKCTDTLDSNISCLPVSWAWPGSHVHQSAVGSCDALLSSLLTTWCQQLHGLKLRRPLRGCVCVLCGSVAAAVYNKTAFYLAVGRHTLWCVADAKSYLVQDAHGPLNVLLGMMPRS